MKTPFKRQCAKIFSKFNYSLNTWLFHFATLLVTFFIVVTVLGKSYENAVIQSIHAVNLEFSQYVDNTSSQAMESIRNYGLQLFYMPSVTKLRTSGVLSSFEAVQAMRELNAYVGSSNIVHSVYVYNGQKAYIFSSAEYGSDTQEKFFDRDGAAYFTKLSRELWLKPIPRVILAKNKTENGVEVYSFIMYESSKRTRYSSALMVNVFADAYNKSFFPPEQENEFLLLSDDYSYIGSSDNYDTSMLETDVSVLKEPLSAGENQGYMVKKRAGDKSVYFYSNMPDSGWHYVRIVPYRSLIAGFDGVKSLTYLVMFVVVVADIIISGIMSVRFHKPLKSFAALFSRISGGEAQSGVAVNSLDYWMHNQKRFETQYIQLMKTEYLRQLLLSATPPQRYWKDILPAYRISFDSQTPTTLILFPKQPGSAALHWVFQMFPSVNMEAVNIQQYTVLLVQPGDSAPLNDICQQILQADVAFCCCSSIVSDISQMHAAFERMCEVYQMRIFFPDCFVLTEGLIKQRIKEYRYPYKLEKQLLQALKSRKYEQAEEAYQLFYQSVLNHRYHAIVLAYKCLYLSVMTVYGETVKTALLPQSYDEDFMEECFQTVSSIEDVHNVFYGLFAKIIAEAEHEKEHKNDEFIQQIHNLVQENYVNPELSPGWIADQMNLSQTYLTKLYRSSEKQSLNDCINSVRIEKAKHLLTESDQTVKEIALQVGIENHQYFYTLFKSSTGTTPSKYRKQAST